MHIGNDQANDTKAEPSVQPAATMNGNSREPVGECRTIKIALLQAAEDTGSLGDRSANMDMEVPVDGTTKTPCSKTDAAQPVLGEPAESRKQKQRELLEQIDELEFSLDALLQEITSAVPMICDEVLLCPHFFQGDEVTPTDTPTDLIDSLTCLSDDEWRYLPLWAGGCDDSSGGVYNDLDVPALEIGGFHGGKCGLGCNGESTLAGSSNWSEIISTVGKAPKEAIDGTATEAATVQSLGDVDMDVRSMMTPVYDMWKR